MLLIRNAADYWSGLLDAPEVGATGAMVVHGGVGTNSAGVANARHSGQVDGSNGREGERRSGFGTGCMNTSHGRAEPHIHTIGQYRRTLRGGFRQAQETTVNLEGPL